MSLLQITGRSGDAVAVAESTINAVASELDGSLLRPDDEGYAASVSLWNAMVAKRPAVVIRAGSTGVVVRAVTFAREEGLEDRARDAYRFNFDRLQATKARYDPHNVFRIKRNISGGSANRA